MLSSVRPVSPVPSMTLQLGELSGWFFAYSQSLIIYFLHAHNVFKLKLCVCVCACVCVSAGMCVPEHTHRGQRFISPTLLQHGLSCFCRAAPSRLAGPQASGQFSCLHLLLPQKFQNPRGSRCTQPFMQALGIPLTRVIRLAALVAAQSSQEPHFSNSSSHSIQHSQISLRLL